MARRRVAAVLSGVLVAGSIVGAMAVASADHSGCPPFERLRYDYAVEFNHGGDLFSTVRVVGFTDFRFCFAVRDRVLEEDIRFDVRGGEYVLRVIGDDFEETHVLRAGANATRWYAHATVIGIQVAGLSGEGEPTLIPAEEPPAAARDRLLLR